MDAPLCPPTTVYLAHLCAMLSLVCGQDECSSPPPALEVKFLLNISATQGVSHGHGTLPDNGPVTLHGDASVTENGLRLDGMGDYASVSGMSSYADDARFTISLWFAKHECSGGIYEYLVSHAGEDGSINIYIGCDGDCVQHSSLHQTACGGWSNLQTSILRFNLMDRTGTTALFDWPLHEAGHFDTVTDQWIHTVLVATPSSLVTYNDGQAVNPSVYGYFRHQGSGMLDSSVNTAYPTTANLYRELSGFVLSDTMYVGGRFDLESDRHFRGRISLLRVYDAPISAAEVQCLFNRGEALLPSVRHALHAYHQCEAGQQCRAVLNDERYVLADICAPGPEECAEDCLAVAGCVGFDFHSQSKFCRLNKVQIPNNPDVVLTDTCGCPTASSQGWCKTLQTCSTECTTPESPECPSVEHPEQWSYVPSRPTFGSTQHYDAIANFNASELVVIGGDAAVVAAINWTVVDKTLFWPTAALHAAPYLVIQQ